MLFGRVCRKRTRRVRVRRNTDVERHDRSCEKPGLENGPVPWMPVLKIFEAIRVTGLPCQLYRRVLALRECDYAIVKGSNTAIRCRFHQREE